MAVRVTPVTPDDFEVVCGWLSDPAINRWLASEWRGRTVSAAVLAAALRGGKSRLYVVRLDEARVGLVALSDIDQQDGLAMIWYLLGDTRYARTGAISRAVGLVSRMAFEELGLRTVFAWIAESNALSRRVLERNGFREAGRMRSATVVDGTVEDRVYFDVRAGELTT
jgi:RimJ/RimL family protein N-acetyltransferase